MTRADRVFSTPPTNASAVPSRRRFLARTAMATAAIVMAPAVAPATPMQADPIFEAIAACRDARKVTDQAFAKVRDLRREAKRLFGAGEEQRGLRQAYIESFIGDEDEYTDGPCDAVWATNEAFAQTVPTTLAGLFAMLAYAGEIEDCEPD